MSRSRFWRVFAFLLTALLAFSLYACAPDYTGDARLGSYTDKETGAYSLTFRADGTGTVSHTSVHGPVTEEEFVFELTGDTLEVLGKTDSGGVIGRNEYRAAFTEENGVYLFVLKEADSGNVLGTFVKSGN